MEDIRRLDFEIGTGSLETAMFTTWTISLRSWMIYDHSGGSSLLLSDLWLRTCMRKKAMAYQVYI